MILDPASLAIGIVIGALVATVGLAYALGRAKAERERERRR